MAIGLRNKKLLAIDWDQKDLRLAMVMSKGDGVELLKAVSVPIPQDVVMQDAESLGAFLREAMRQSHISAKSAIMNIPREHVVLNTLNLPPTPFEEMPALVQFQIVKELPFSADQATVDFAVCGHHDPKSPCSVLVAAVRHDDLEFYRKVAREAGFSIERIGLRPYANLLSVLSSMPDVRDKSLLIVEVGPHLSEIDVVQSGALTFSRAASVSLPEFDKLATDNIIDSRITSTPIANLQPDESSGEAVKQLMVDVIRSFEAYRATTSSVKIEQVVVCGATGIEAELAESLAARFGVRAELFSPEGALDLPEQRAKELRGFSAVLGLAMGQGQEKIETFDFLNPKKPISKRKLRMKKVPVAIATAVFLIGAAFTFHLRFVKPEQDKLDKLMSSIRRDQKREKPIKAFTNQVEALENWVQSEQYWPEVLVALTNAFPPEREAYVTRLDFDIRSERRSTKRTSYVTLKLRTSKLGSVNQQTKSLRDHNFLNVIPGAETPSNANDRYKFDTKVDAEIPSRPKPEKKKKVPAEESEKTTNGDTQAKERSGSEAASSESGDSGKAKAQSDRSRTADERGESGR